MLWCVKLDRLKMLFLEGNPLVLTQHYKQIISERMPTLKVLDGHTVIIDQEALEQHNKFLMKKMKTMGSKTSFVSRGSVVEENSFKLLINPTVSLDFHLRVAKNIQQGRYLIPEENCLIEPEKLDEIPVERKSSVYWLTFTGPKGETVQTEKRAYI